MRKSLRHNLLQWGPAFARPLPIFSSISLSFITTLCLLLSPKHCHRHVPYSPL
ncbi:hypothetical protein LINPERHAP2_LOCUS16081, partial [Linum perenne]